MHLIDQTGTDWLKPAQLKFMQRLQELRIENPCAGITLNSKPEPDFIEPTLILRRDQRMLLSAEAGDSLLAYYSEPHGYPWIHPTIEALAHECGVFLEWENPGAACVWPI